MAFPTTGILETFTGSTNSALDSDWTVLDGAGLPNISDNNEATNNVNGPYVGAWYDVTTYGADSETYLRISDEGDYVGVFGRLSSPSASYDGYQASWTGSSLTAQRLDNGVQTQLGSTVGMTLTAGSILGLEIVGDFVSVYVDEGSGWQQWITEEDATYPGTGYLGFDTYDPGSTIRLDDFGGGTVAGGTPLGRTWSVVYSIQGQLARTWSILYDIENQLGRTWSVLYDIENQLGRSWDVQYNIQNNIGRTWSVLYDIENQLSRTWAIDYSISAALARDWQVIYFVGDPTSALQPFFVSRRRPNSWAPTEYSSGRRR